MGFLIKSAFWLSLVLLVIPFDAGADGEAGRTIGPFEAIHAAREAIGDIGGICKRKPDVCETGRAALQTITIRAREASRVAFEMLEDAAPADGDATVEALIAEAGDERAMPADATVATGSVPKTN